MKIVKINAMWCSGCIVMRKVWNEVKSEYSDLDITEYDYDMDSDMVKNYNVGDILPVAIFYKGNNEVARLNGEHTKDEIVSIIKEYS